MEKLTVLGTGNAMALRCYNTCFALHEGQQAILVDAGGGNGILKQLQQAQISYNAIRHLIVTHAHTDHLLGVVWVVRKIGTLALEGSYEGVFHIWCHDELAQAIATLVQLTLTPKLQKLMGTVIVLHPVADGQQEQLLGHTVTFFDIHSTKAKQFGFSACKEGQVITCLGDEPYNPLCRRYVEGSQWLLCEAFCLYEHRDRFKPYEKNHSTVKDACQLAQELQIPHLVLWHTEDKTYDQRQELYTAEGRQYYTGDLHVPYDLDVIDLQPQGKEQQQ